MHVDSTVITLALLVLLALAFDFMNGFHDAANSIATVVSTRVLKPYQAVVWAAFFNFVAFWLFEPKVAATVGKGIIEPGFVDNAVIFGALIGAITWNVITWYFGIPSSSSHALIGGMIGAGMAKAGFDPLVMPGIIKTAAFIFISPLLGMLIGGLLMLAISWAFFRVPPQRCDRFFRLTQLLSSALYSIGHGSNDAQKTMGIIWLMLMSRGMASADHLPVWVVVSCYVAISVGTLFGGWRIIRTMGQKLTRLTPASGSAASLGGAITLFIASHGGIPVSTTHTITGAILGTGSVQNPSRVRWGLATGLVYAWVMTIPAAALVAAVFYWIGRMFIR
ncbi:MAG: inorganic phosphate transporter [Nevskiaceae bacterium]|jgi:PiT family inorganic phosphate transporter|nr:inorganic phosphate transporter [Nevskiaceae bacterium]